MMVTGVLNEGQPGALERQSGRAGAVVMKAKGSYFEEYKIYLGLFNTIMP